jgi:hypothetical protein
MLKCVVSKNRKSISWSNGLAKETHHTQLALLTLEQKAEALCDLIVSDFLVANDFDFQFVLIIEPGPCAKAKALFQEQKTHNDIEAENELAAEITALEERVQKAKSLIKGERLWVARTSGQNINVFRGLRAETAKDAHDLSLVLGQRTSYTPQVVVLEEMEVPENFGDLMPPRDKEIRGQLHDIIGFSEDASRAFRRSYYNVDTYPESMDIPGFEASFELAEPVHLEAAAVASTVKSETFGTFHGASENAMDALETLRFAVNILLLNCLDMPGLANTSAKLSITAVILEDNVEFKVTLEGSNFDEEWVYWSARDFVKDWGMRLSMLASLPDPTSCYCLSVYDFDHKGEIVSADCEVNAVKAWFALTQGFEKITRMPKRILRVPKLLEVRPELAHETA